MAAPVLTPTHFGDLQQGTLARYENLKVTDIMSPNDMTEYVFMNTVLNDAQVETVSGGHSFKWDIILNGTNSAEPVGLGYQDNPTIVDTLTQATADWRHVKVDWAGVKQVDQMNQEPARIVNIKLMQEKAAMFSLMELMESLAFGPSVTSTNTLDPWGFKTWITRQYSSSGSNVAYSADGFFGGQLATSPTLGIADTSKWRNWVFQYTNVDDADCIRRLKKAIVMTAFKSPVKGIPEIGPGLKRIFFSNYGLIAPLEEYLKASNQNLGMDVTRYAGAVLINGNPLIRVPYLEADTTNPIYGVNLQDVKIYRLKNFWMRKCYIAEYPGQHNIEASFLDSTYQVVMTNRRKSFVGFTSTTDPT